MLEYKITLKPEETHFTAVYLHQCPRMGDVVVTVNEFNGEREWRVLNVRHIERRGVTLVVKPNLVYDPVDGIS
jgi:hypothetical protein